jgi:hypothetical protein
MIYLFDLFIWYDILIWYDISDLNLEFKNHLNENSDC